MDCKKIKELVNDYITDNLNNTLKTEFEKHIEKCQKCRGYVKSQKKTHNQLNVFFNTEKDFKLSDNFDNKLLKNINKNKKNNIFNFWLRTAAGFLILVIVSYLFYTNYKTDNISQLRISDISGQQKIDLVSNEITDKKESVINKKNKSDVINKNLKTGKSNNFAESVRSAVEPIKSVEQQIAVAPMEEKKVEPVNEKVYMNAVTPYSTQPESKKIKSKSIIQNKKTGNIYDIKKLIKHYYNNKKYQLVTQLVKSEKVFTKKNTVLKGYTETDNKTLNETEDLERNEYDTETLNIIADSFYKTDNIDSALFYYKKSVETDSNQLKIKEIIKNIK